MIPLEILPTFLFYSFITSITPGPANLSSLSLALSRGKNVALRQWAGLFIGFTIVSLISGFVAFFLGTALNEYAKVLSMVGAAYILWLAIHLLREKVDQSGSAELPAISSAAQYFRRGIFVQLTNVKIMFFCVTVQTTFLLPYNHSLLSVLLLALVLPFIGPVCNLAWLFTGAALQRFFVHYQKQVNAVMAASLALCAASIVLN
ncbi:MULTISPECIES: LysE family transporter [unclassified Fibrobacter]|uniref:LysE family transporter n=1 Tax=unclassified Fibrobacter TaxID=2634177 RepID=UPI000D7B3D9A|nr:MULTISPECIES: LysE family transporter [unclassified Fibrobacter]PWJ60832.1 cysteine/O-acetylserine efflux protein [Fibrobacter sp. UWR4]PZW65550.1 threonine/homoserine/homoserine lactone efflux protein [Fibrobacter sp. UWR1]